MNGWCQGGTGGGGGPRMSRSCSGVKSMLPSGLILYWSMKLGWRFGLRTRLGRGLVDLGCLILAG